MIVKYLNIKFGMLFLLQILLLQSACFHDEFQLKSITDKYQVGIIPSQPNPALIFFPKPEGGIYQVLIHDVINVYVKDSVIYVKAMSETNEAAFEYFHVIISRSDAPISPTSINEEEYLACISRRSVFFEYHK